MDLRHQSKEGGVPFLGKLDRMRQPSRSKAAILERHSGSPFTPWRQDLLGPREGVIQWNVELELLSEGVPGLLKSGKTVKRR